MWDKRIWEKGCLGENITRESGPVEVTRNQNNRQFYGIENCWEKKIRKFMTHIVIFISRLSAPNKIYANDTR